MRHFRQNGLRPILMRLVKWRKDTGSNLSYHSLRGEHSVSDRAVAGSIPAWYETVSWERHLQQHRIAKWYCSGLIIRDRGFESLSKRCLVYLLGFAGIIPTSITAVYDLYRKGEYTDGSCRICPVLWSAEMHHLWELWKAWSYDSYIKHLQQ